MKHTSALVILALFSAGCAKRVPPASAAIAPLPPNSAEYVDLSPGWRLRMVAAVTKSGSFDAGYKVVKQEGNVIGMKASDDLIGYETAFWSVLARPGGGVFLQLASATLTVDGKPAPIEKPTRALIHAPRSARFIRIFYLTRKSDADHNMLIAGVSRLEQWEAFTQAFHGSPSGVCEIYAPKRHQYCEWIPAALAVRPEVPKIVDGTTEWPKQ